MAITFSIATTEIIVTSGQTEATCQEILNAARLFEEQFQMMGFDHIVDAGGKLPIGGGIFTEIVLSIRYPWTLRFEDEDIAHCKVTGGTLLAFDAIGDPRPVSTNYGLTISQSISGTLAVTGSGVTTQDKIDIALLSAAQTWAETEAITLLAQVLDVHQVETGRWRLDPTTFVMTFYAANGTDPLFEFDMKNSAGNPSVSDIFERVPK
jgi:hypothetical protein